MAWILVDLAVINASGAPVHAETQGPHAEVNHGSAFALSGRYL